MNKIKYVFIFLVIVSVITNLSISFMDAGTFKLSSLYKLANAQDPEFGDYFCSSSEVITYEEYFCCDDGVTQGFEIMGTLTCIPDGSNGICAHGSYRHYNNCDEEVLEPAGESNCCFN